MNQQGYHGYEEPTRDHSSDVEEDEEGRKDLDLSEGASQLSRRGKKCAKAKDKALQNDRDSPVESQSRWRNPDRSTKKSKQLERKAHRKEKQDARENSGIGE
jgi:hypothetical protein